MAVLLPESSEVDNRMNWRAWLYDRLSADSNVFDLLPVGQIMAAGSLEGKLEYRPFIVIRLGINTVELNDEDAPLISSQFATIWVHDEPGSYRLIDDILVAVRLALVGQVNEAIACLWQGDSGELADNDQGTIVRNSSYRLVGRL